MILFVPLLLLAYNEMRGHGLCFSNLNDFHAVQAVMDTWKTRGFLAAVDAMEPKRAYDCISENQFDNPLEHYRQVNQYMISEEAWEHLWEEPTLYNAAGNFLAIVLPETAAQTHLTWRRLDTAYGMYYTNVNLELHAIRFSDDMKRIVPEAIEPDALFSLVGACDILPQRLYDRYSSQYAQVQDWYQRYANYYKAMGYAAYTDLCREQIKQTAHHWDRQQTTIAAEKLDDISSYNTDSWVRWRVTYCNGTQAEMNFTVKDGGCQLVSIDRGSGANFPQEFADAVNRILEQYCWRY